jgi:hypothetical protein
MKTEEKRQPKVAESWLFFHKNPQNANSLKG